MTALVQAAGLRERHVETIRGGRPFAVVYRDELDECLVERLVAQRGASAWRFVGETRWRYRRECQAPLEGPLLMLQHLDHLAVSTGRITRAIGHLAGVSPRTVNHWLERERLPGESNRACILRIWHDAACDARAAAAEERAAIMAAEGLEPPPFEQLMAQVGGVVWVPPWVRAPASEPPDDEGDDGPPS